MIVVSTLLVWILLMTLGVDLLMFNTPLTSTPSTLSFEEDLPDASFETPPPIPDTNEASTSKEKKEHMGLPLNLSFPDKFSIRVKSAITAGNVLPVRRQLIADIATFYHGLCSTLRQGDYKRIAMKMCERFPELKEDITDSQYWV